MSGDDLYAEPINPQYVWPSGQTAEDQGERLSTGKVAVILTEEFVTGCATRRNQLKELRRPKGRRS